MQSAHKTFDSFAAEVIAVDYDKASKEDIASFYSKLNVDYINTKANEHFLKRKLDAANERFNSILEEKGKTKLDFETNALFKNQLLGTDSRAELVYKEVAAYEQALSEVKKDVEKFWDKKSANKAFKAQVNKRLNIEEQSKDAEKVTETLENIEKATTPEEVDTILWPAGHNDFGKDVVGPMPATKEEETSIVKDLLDRANNTSKASELNDILEDAKKRRFNFYTTEKIIEALETRVKAVVEQQAEFKKAIETTIEEYYQHEAKLSEDLKATESRLQELVTQQQKKMAELATNKDVVNVNAPEVIVLFIAEAEDELSKINAEIKQLKEKKKALKASLANIKKNLEYLYRRYDEITPKGFNSVSDVLQDIANAKEGLSPQRMLAHELEYQVVVKEIMIEELEASIDTLEYYKSVLEGTLKTYQANKKKPNPRQIEFLKGELSATLADLKESKARLREERARLSVFGKGFNFRDKFAFDKLTDEEVFWNNLRKAKKARYKTNAAAPVIKAKAAERKQGLREAKLAKEIEDKAKHEAAIEAKKKAEAAKAEVANRLAGHYNVGEEFTIKKEHGVSNAVVGQTGKITGFTEKGSVEITLESGSKVYIKPTYTDTTAETEYKDIYSTEGGIEERVVEDNENKEDVTNTVYERRNNAKVMSTNESDNFNLFHFVNPAVLDYERSPIRKVGQSKNFSLAPEQTRKDGKPNTISDRAKVVAEKIIAGQTLTKDDTNLVYKDNNFEEIGIYVRNEALRRFKTKDFSDINFLIDFLPLNVNLNESASAPLETASLTKSKGFTEVFNSSSRILRQALIKEMVHNGVKPEDLSTTVAGQFNGQLKVAPKVNDKVAENKVIDLYQFGGEVKNITASDFYVVDSAGVLKNPDGRIFPMAKRQAPGELFIAINTANGSKFPLKLNVKKIQKEEAEVLYELYNYRFADKSKGKGEKISSITDSTLKKQILDLLNRETTYTNSNGTTETLSLTNLFKSVGKTLEDITIKDVVDFYIWDATANFKSQVRFDEGLMKVLDKTYSKEDFNTPEAKAEFIKLLTENKRHQVRFAKRPTEDANALTLQQRSYLEYMLKTGIINTNAIVGEPTFQGKTNIYLDTNKVKVRNKDSQFNVGVPKTYASTLIGTNDKLKQLVPALFKKKLELTEDGQYYIDPNEVIAEGKKQSKYRRVSILKQEDPSKPINGNAPNMYNGGKRGDVVDDLMREFFSSGFKNKDLFVSRGKEILERVNKEKTKHGDIQISDEAFKDLYSIFEDYKIEFDRLGLTVYSNVPTLYGKFTNDGPFWGNFAGTVDLLAQENETGQWIIIDLKTSSVDRGLAYEGEKDTYEYQKKDQIQQVAYAQLFQNMTGLSIKRLMIMPIIGKPNDGGQNGMHSEYTKFTKSAASTPLLTIDNSKTIYELKKLTPATNIDPGKKKTSQGKVDISKMNIKRKGTQGEEHPEIPQDNDMEGVEVSEDVANKGLSALDKLMKRTPKKEEAPKEEPKKEEVKPVEQPKANPNQWQYTDASLDAMMADLTGGHVNPVQDPEGKLTNIGLGARSYIVMNLDTYEPITDKEAIYRILKYNLDDPNPAKAAVIEKKWRSVWDKRFETSKPSKAPTVTTTQKTVENNQEVIRKVEEKVVSLPKTKPQVETLDFNKLSDAQAMGAIETLMEDAALFQTIMNSIDKNPTATIQEQLKEIFRLLEAEEISRQELRQRCKI